MFNDKKADLHAFGLEQSFQRVKLRTSFSYAITWVTLELLQPVVRELPNSLIESPPMGLDVRKYTPDTHQAF